ncbi:hypothetical protein MMC13_005327 [Lambiella insularis]|nr:hypothetical protein [Lambiella insularis]
MKLFLALLLPASALAAVYSADNIHIARALNARHPHPIPLLQPSSAFEIAARALGPDHAQVTLLAGHLLRRSANARGGNMKAPSSTKSKGGKGGKKPGDDANDACKSAECKKAQAECNKAQDAQGDCSAFPGVGFAACEMSKDRVVGKHCDKPILRTSLAQTICQEHKKDFSTLSDKMKACCKVAEQGKCQIGKGTITVN